MEKVKSPFVNFAVSIVAIFSFLIVCELTLRILVPEKSLNNHHRLFCQYDAVLGWKHIPKSSAGFVNTLACIG
jgi:hypothetical protein